VDRSVDGAISLTLDGRIVLEVNSEDLPGSDPRNNIQDIYSHLRAFGSVTYSLCPLTERYTANGAGDGSSSGTTRPEYYPSQERADIMFERNAHKTLGEMDIEMMWIGGLNNLVDSGEFNYIFISSLYGGNHNGADHREFRAVDISKIKRPIYIDSNPTSILDLNNAGNARELCRIATLMKNTARPDHVIGSVRMKNYVNTAERLNCAGDPIIIGDATGYHNNHMHLEWN